MKDQLDLKEEYSRLRRKKYLGYIISGLVFLLLLCSFGALLMILQFIQKLDWVDVGLSIIASHILVISTVIAYRKQKKYILKNNKLIFIDFYKHFLVLNDLDEYLKKDAEEIDEVVDEQKEKLVNAQNAIRSLSYIIQGWTLDTAPRAFKIIPNSISTNLTEKIVPIIQKKDKDQFSKFLVGFYSLLSLLAKRELTIDEWTSFLDSVKLINITEQSTIVLESKLASKPHKKQNRFIRIFLKPTIVSVISWIISFILLTHDNVTEIQSGVISATVALAVLPVVIYVQNQITEKQDYEQEDNIN